GFDSHACMRLRERDLYELFHILMKGGSEKLPLNVNYFIYNLGANGKRERVNGLLPTVGAYPPFVYYYQAVKNFAEPGEPPITKRDPKENLLYLDALRGSPEPILMKTRGFDEGDRKILKTYDLMVAGVAFAKQPPPLKAGM